MPSKAPFVETPPKLDRAAVTGALERLLASHTFRSARGQRDFMRYVVTAALEGRSDQVKEYSIGAVALKRGDDFDPRLDPIVRTQARKLRSRLEKYYSSEGAQENVVFTIAKGSYVPTISVRHDDTPPVPQAVAVSVPAVDRWKQIMGGFLRRTR